MSNLSNVQKQVINEIKKTGYLRRLQVFETCSRLTTIYKTGNLNVRQSTFDALIRKNIIEFSEMRRETEIYKLTKQK